MNTIVKLILSVMLGLLGFFSLGLWVYVPVVGIIISLGLCTGAILGIRVIWQKKKVEGEGDIFKNKDKLNKD